MQKLFFLVLFGMLIIGCAKDPIGIPENDSKSKLFSTEGLYNRANCISNTGKTLTIRDDTVTHEIYKMSTYHNEIMDSLAGNVTFNSCSVTETIYFESQIDTIIERNSNYLDLIALGVVDSSLFTELIPICEADSIEEFKLLLEETIDSFLTELDAYNEIPDLENEILEDFFAEVIDSVYGAKVDVEKYYTRIDRLSTKFNEGVVSYLIINIYDFSYCHWYDFAYSNFPQLRIPWLVAIAAAAQMIALNDATGGLIGTAIWLYKNAPNIEGPDKGQQLADSALRGAVSTSGGPLGGLLEELIFGGG